MMALQICPTWLGSRRSTLAFVLSVMSAIAEAVQPGIQGLTQPAAIWSPFLMPMIAGSPTKRRYSCLRSESAHQRTTLLAQMHYSMEEVGTVDQRMVVHLTGERTSAGTSWSTVTGFCLRLCWCPLSLPKLCALM